MARISRHRYLTAGVVIVVALAVFAAFELVTAPRISAVTPSSGSYLRDATVRVTVTVPGLHRLKNVVVTVDGVPVKGIGRDGDRVTINTARLTDGGHAVRFTGTSLNVFGRHVSKTWRFTVDTVAPALTLTRPSLDRMVTSSPQTISGETDAGAKVSATRGSATVTGVADTDGHFSLSLVVDDGSAPLMLAATDAAGNTSSLTRTLVVDARPPELTVAALPTTVRTNTPLLRFTARDLAKAPKVRVRVDGEDVTDRTGGHPDKIRLTRLTDGEHTIAIVAVDSGRNVTRNEQTILVDTTEKLGGAILTAGARGRDVLELQRKLKKAGFLHRRPTSVLDRAAIKAVKRFETRMGMAPDGIVGPRVVGALTGRIVVDLSECRLYLYKDGKLVKTYSVAVGQPAYPTPTGDYYIVTMVKNPTWIPPDSPWARGLEPIPPGPGNPVGTRWIGTSARGVGIHGTPADYSIGTHASHGCIRMHMWDVEDLFGRIAVGVPVTIRP
jgi:lipoprotein-anchoring transpeptidase ErfK/SrfK